METSCGFIAGFIYCFGMITRTYPEPPENENISLASFYGVIFVLGIIPLWHRLNRIQPNAKLPEWAKALKSYGIQSRTGCTDNLMVDGSDDGFMGGIWMVIFKGTGGFCGVGYQDDVVKI